MEKPKEILSHTVGVIQFEKTIKAAHEYLDYMNSSDFCEDGTGNYENDIFEKVMIEIFGGKVFDFINSKYD